MIIYCGYTKRPRSVARIANTNEREQSNKKILEE